MKWLVIAGAMVLSGCATSGTAYNHPNWHHYSNPKHSPSDRTVAALVGAIVVGAVIENAAEQRRHEQRMLSSNSKIVTINGVRYKEYYQNYSPCPTGGHSCVLLTREILQ